jgi:hypothetical protein
MESEAEEATVSNLQDSRSHCTAAEAQLPQDMVGGMVPEVVGPIVEVGAGPCAVDIADNLNTMSQRRHVSQDLRNGIADDKGKPAEGVEIGDMEVGCFVGNLAGGGERLDGQRWTRRLYSACLGAAGVAHWACPSRPVTTARTTMLADGR